MEDSNKNRNIWDVLTTRSTKLTVLSGILFLLLGLLLNQWSVGWLIAEDHDISSVAVKVMIGIIQVLCIGAGVWIVFKKPVPSIALSINSVVALGLGIGIVLGGYGSLGAISLSDPVDHAVPTLPSFACGPQDAICNVTQAAGLGDMLAVTGKSVARYLGQHSCITLLSTLETFEHQHRGPTRRHQAGALGIEGTTGVLWVAGGKAAQGIEARHRFPIDLLSPAAQHPVLETAFDQHVGLAQRVCA